MSGHASAEPNASPSTGRLQEASVPLGGVAQAPASSETAGATDAASATGSAPAQQSVAVIDVVFEHDRRSVQIISSKGISHYETTLCDGSSSKVELPGGSDLREISVGPFAQAIVSIRVKAGSDLDGTTFVSDATCGGDAPTDAPPVDPAPTGPVVGPTDPVNPTTPQTTTVLPPPPPAASPSCAEGASPGTIAAIGAFAIQLRSCNGNVVRLYSDPNVSVTFPDMSMSFGVGHGTRTVEVGADARVTWSTDSFHRVRAVEVEAGGRSHRIVPTAFALEPGDAYAAQTLLTDTELRDLAIELAACEGPVFQPIACVDPQLLLDARPARIDSLAAGGTPFATATTNITVRGDTGDPLRSSTLVAFATPGATACAPDANRQALVPGTIRMAAGWWDWWSWWAPQVQLRGAFTTTMSFVPPVAGSYRACAYLSRLGSTAAVGAAEVEVQAPTFTTAAATPAPPIERATTTVTLSGTADLQRWMTAFVSPSEIACAPTAAGHAALPGVSPLTPRQGNDLQSVPVVRAWSWAVEHRFQKAGAWRLCTYVGRAVTAAPDALGDVVVQVVQRPKGRGA